MTAIPTMPGNWPLREEAESGVEFDFPRINTQLAESALQVFMSHSATSATSSRSSPDDLFFDRHGPSSGIDRNGESSTPSYLIFEPVVESVSRDEPIDWRRYEPPQELLHAPDGTSEEIRRILESSVERIKARHEEEEQQRIAHAKRERPLTRTGRASVKPLKREYLTTGGLHPLGVPSSESGSSSRLRTGSASSTLSNDSGYASQSPSSPNLSPSPRDGHSSSPSRSGKTRGFGFHQIFGRKNKPSFNFDGLNAEQGSRPTSSASGEISIPVPTQELVTAPLTTTECVSCLDDFETSEMIPLACHSYCTECFNRLITTALESETHWPAKCCLNPIPITTIMPHIDKAMKAKYAQRDAEWSIPAGDRIYCAQPNCSAWIPPKDVDTQASSAKCSSCAQKSCTICRGPFHNGSDCPQDPALLATIQLAELEGWKRCYQCHALVEHNKGCRHMTCRCKAQFCYICSAKWRTCACTDAQLDAIQRRAESHRNETARQARERERREAAEELERRELEAALQAVAEFEAAEAERERLAAEARRVREEEERRIQEEERQRRVVERLAAINARFAQLKADLGALHDTQRTLIAERYEFETSRLQHALQDTLEVLTIRHPAEIAALTASSKALILAAEQKFIEEYRARHEEEKRIEENYLSDLEAFWTGKPDGEFRVRDSRDELRRDQHEAYRNWNQYRKAQLEKLREGEERKMESLRMKQRAEVREVEGRARIEGVEWSRTMFAEGKWVEAVLGERRGMLEEEERAEYARGV